MDMVMFWFWYSGWVLINGMNQNQTQKAFGFGLVYTHKGGLRAQQMISAHMIRAFSFLDLSPQELGRILLLWLAPL
jgi:hypothetical protein